MEEGWTCFGKIFAWAQISHCFTSFYFTLQQHRVNQRFSSGILMLSSFFYISMPYALPFVWESLLYPFFSSHSHSLLKTTHNSGFFFPHWQVFPPVSSPTIQGKRLYFCPCFISLPTNRLFSDTPFVQRVGHDLVTKQQQLAPTGVSWREELSLNHAPTPWT